MIITNKKYLQYQILISRHVTDHSFITVTLIAEGVKKIKLYRNVYRDDKYLVKKFQEKLFQMKQDTEIENVEQVQFGLH